MVASLQCIKAMLHSLGIKQSLYVNDGRMSAASAGETVAKTTVTLWCLQLAGWNIQWAKTVLEPAQRLLHLGLYTDTVSMTYTTPTEKLEVTEKLLDALISSYFANVPVDAEDVAVVVGKLLAILRSHSSILLVMS